MSIYMDKGILLYSIVMAAILGAVFGSFLNCAAWRIARDEPFWKGRSRCPTCGHTLGALDLIPIFSWLFLRGKCRWCGAKVSARYMLTECFFAAVTAACLLRFDLTALCLRNWVFLCCLFCLALVDLESFEIPDGCLILAAAAWVLALPFTGAQGREIGQSVLSGVVFGGGLLLLSLLLDHILQKESLGGGDIKLFAVVGLYLGLIGTLFAVMLACILGLAFAHLRRRRGAERGSPIPFGPAIAAAAGAMLLWGGPLVAWYGGLLRG